MRQYDLGDDDGYVSITIGGQTIEVCPEEELAVIDEKAKTAGQTEGQPFVEIIRLHLAERLERTDKPVSSHAAVLFYRTMEKASKDLTDFFAKRLGSLFTSTLTQGGSTEPDSTPTLETSPASLPKNRSAGSGTRKGKRKQESTS